MQDSNEMQKGQNPVLDLQRDQGLILARRYHHDDSNSSISI